MHALNIRSRPAVLIFVLLAGAMLLFAGDTPWKDKPYDKWDAKDLQKILTDSPWVQMTTIRRNWRPVSEKDTPPPPELGGAPQQFPGAGRSTAPTTPQEAETSTRELNVYVYWGSSRIMRIASAREAVLQGAMQEADVEKQAAVAQAEYEIVLRMADMTPFLRNDEKSFQSTAFLQAKKSKLKTPASHVVYQRDFRGGIRDVVFFFPKQTSDDLPTISSAETDVQFNCRLADTALHVDFKPQKMVDQYGRDL